MNAFGGRPSVGDYQDLREILMKMDALKRQNLDLLSQLEQEKQNISHLRSAYDAKLGAVEYENENLKKEQKVIEENYRKRTLDMENSLKRLEEDVVKKDAILASNDAKSVTLTNKIRELENYLGDLPTHSDYSEFQNQFNYLKQHNARLCSENQMLFANVQEAERQVREKVVALKSIEDREHIMQMHIDDLTERLQRHNALGPPPQRLSRGVIEDLKSDTRRWRDKYEAAVFQMEGLVKQHSEKQEASEKEVASLQEEISSQKAIVLSLEKIIKTKQSEIYKLRCRITSLCSEKQGLLSDMLDLRDKAQQMDVIVNSGWFKRQRGLATDLCDCVRDVKSILRVLTHCMKGRMPDPSELFPLSDQVPCSHSDKENSISLSFQYLDASINQVKELRSDVDAIRRFLSDRLAENIGSEVSCVVQ